MTIAKAHPLDPLSDSEVTAAAEACHKYARTKGIADIRFNTITLKEPLKSELLAHKAGKNTTVPRLAFSILQFPPSPLVVEAVVDVSSREVVSWNELEGVHPLASPDDCFDAEDIVKADARVQELLMARGISDVTLVACDPWSVHLAPCEGRLIQTFMYVRSSPDDNHYAHPLDFTPVVDLNLKKVVHIDLPCGEGGVPVPQQDVNYHRKLMVQPWREDLKELTVVQPEGPSFQVVGNEVYWQKWCLRVGFNYREGLVLHDVRYCDEGRERPVLWRGSLVEMAVPYADPNNPFQRKCAFDVGDYGLGNCTTTLELGCDCLGHIHYFDAVLNNSKGEPVVIKKAVCLHEEDHSILWKHVEYRTGHSEVRRSRRLVLSFIATVVNYEYAFYWYFYQDGSIGYEIKLTGELSTNVLSPGEGAPAWGTLVAPGVNAQVHQHMFCARLDLSVDDGEGGKQLRVCEVGVGPAPEGPANPYGNAFTVQELPLMSEAKAQRVADASRGVYWKVFNPQVKNGITGSPVAYKLMPQPQPLLLAAPSSLVYKKGRFATRNLWVTPYDDAQRWPAGDYPLQSAGGQGLPVWTAQDRPLLADADPVLWYCFGVTHIPRVEDFPVMPVETVGFMLKPVGFFDGNPAIDLPFQPNTASKQCNGCTTVVSNHSSQENGA